MIYIDLFENLQPYYKWYIGEYMNWFTGKNTKNAEMQYSVNL